MPEKDLQYYLRLPYTRKLEPRKDATGDAYFLAWIGELPFVKVDGSSREEALYKLNETLSDWLQVMLEMGDEIPEPALWPDNIGGYRPDPQRVLPLEERQPVRPARQVKAAEVAPWTMFDLNESPKLATV